MLTILKTTKTYQTIEIRSSRKSSQYLAQCFLGSIATIWVLYFLERWEFPSTVDGRNPANQLRLVVYPIIYKVFIHPKWCRISSINSHFLLLHFLPQSLFEWKNGCMVYLQIYELHFIIFISEKTSPLNHDYRSKLSLSSPATKILTSDIRDLLRNLKLTIKIFLSRTLCVLQNPVKHMLFDVSGSTMVKYV